MDGLIGRTGVARSAGNVASAMIGNDPRRRFREPHGGRDGGWRALVRPVPLRAPGAFRWAARSVGAAVTLFSLVMVIGEGIAEESGEGVSAEGVGVALLTAWLAASLMVGWRWERIGGLSAIVAGVALGIFISQTAGSNVLLVTFLLPLPIVAVGGAFLAANRWESTTRS